MIKVGNAQAFGVLCHSSPILMMYLEVIIQICSSYYLTLQLQIEMAITVDVFVKATYNIKEDRPLALSHMNILFLSFYATTGHYPNTTAICT